MLWLKVTDPLRKGECRLSSLRKRFNKKKRLVHPNISYIPLQYFTRKKRKYYKVKSVGFTKQLKIIDYYIITQFIWSVNTYFMFQTGLLPWKSDGIRYLYCKTTHAYTSATQHTETVDKLVET